jgi:hypothetical protein
MLRQIDVGNGHQTIEKIAQMSDADFVQELFELEEENRSID